MVGLLITGLMVSMSVGLSACGVTGTIDETQPENSTQLMKSTEKTETENTETENTETEVTEPIVPQAGLATIKNLLATAMEPVGSTMYVWGGGWNKEDTGAGIEAVTIGVSQNWTEFMSEQNASYDYNNTRYQIHDGLDCSGYIGWVVYNNFHTKNNEEGYVMKATTMARTFAEDGWGDYIAVEDVNDWKAGDIMSMNDHVWMVIGTCEDGSVVFTHSSPPGVQICGTRNEDGSESEAVILARQYMSTYYPKWYAKYPVCAKEYSYLTDSSQMRWNRDTLSDADDYTNMSAEEILQDLFGA